MERIQLQRLIPYNCLLLFSSANDDTGIGAIIPVHSSQLVSLTKDEVEWNIDTDPQPYTKMAYYDFVIILDTPLSRLEKILDLSQDIQKQL